MRTEVATAEGRETDLPGLFLFGKLFWKGAEAVDRLTVLVSTLVDVPVLGRKAPGLAFLPVPPRVATRHRLRPGRRTPFTRLPVTWGP